MNKRLCFLPTLSQSTVAERHHRVRHPLGSDQSRQRTKADGRSSATELGSGENRMRFWNRVSVDSAICCLNSLGGPTCHRKSKSLPRAGSSSCPGQLPTSGDSIQRARLQAERSKRRRLERQPVQQDNDGEPGQGVDAHDGHDEDERAGRRDRQPERDVDDGDGSDVAVPRRLCHSSQRYFRQQMQKRESSESSSLSLVFFQATNTKSVVPPTSNPIAGR